MVAKRKWYPDVGVRCHATNAHKLLRQLLHQRVLHGMQRAKDLRMPGVEPPAFGIYAVDAVRKCEVNCHCAQQICGAQIFRPALRDQLCGRAQARRVPTLVQPAGIRGQRTGRRQARANGDDCNALSAARPLRHQRTTRKHNIIKMRREQYMLQRAIDHDWSRC